MMLAVTLRAPLQSAFGSDGYGQIRQAMDLYVQGLGGTTLALDDPAEMDQLHLPPILTADPGSLLISIRSVLGAVDGVDSLLLVGNDSVIPHFQLTNPIADRVVDPDATVPSDNPYGTNADTRAQYLAPPLPLGRIPLPVNGTSQDALDLLAAAGTYRASRTARGGSAVITNADWALYSQSASTTLPGPVDFHVAPGYWLAAGIDLQREFSYVNLHGFSGDPVWKAYDAVQGQFVTVVSPDLLQGSPLAGSLVFAENCYGAQIAGRKPGDSCALTLTQQGAAFIGATGLSFGSYLAPGLFLQDADAFASAFFRECSGGATVGAALATARAGYLADSSSGADNPYKQKTLLQFILLGDPTWN